MASAASALSDGMDVLTSELSGYRSYSNLVALHNGHFSEQPPGSISTDPAKAAT